MTRRACGIVARFVVACLVVACLVVAMAAHGAVAAEAIVTRSGTFEPSNYADLPGWRGDDHLGAWQAFRETCRALSRRAAWAAICGRSSRVAADAPSVRAFFEAEFQPFLVVNPDATRDGDLTGYYEPLLDASTQRDAVYRLPVYGPPRDLYTLDWKDIPAAQRGRVVHVVAQGRRLVVVDRRSSDSHALDTSRFTLDTRDRHLRVRLAGGVAEPYPARAEIDAGVDAPVIAYVDDPLALYVMQVQGCGRLRLRDGSVMRLQFAEQNGRPFRPVQVVAKPATAPTRGVPAEREEPDRFELATPEQADTGASPPAPGLTRGIPRAPSATPRDAKPPGDRADAIVEALLRQVDPSASAARPQPPTVSASRAARRAVDGSTRPGSSADAAPEIVRAIAADPSYVFFQLADDQSAQRGPVGALGVPLTPERSIAVDPRITPLGYPVYLSSPTAGVRRLVVAQDTGGAIRGAVRADYFRGFGSAAGRLARQTRARMNMWVLLPKADVRALQADNAALTRGLARRVAGEPADCLVADGVYCSESSQAR